MAGRTIDDGLHTLHIGLPGTIGTPVRVRDLNAESHALVAKLALCHPLHLLAIAHFYYNIRNTYKMQEKLSSIFPAVHAEIRRLPFWRSRSAG